MSIHCLRGKVNQVKFEQIINANFDIKKATYHADNYARIAV